LEPLIQRTASEPYQATARVVAADFAAIDYSVTREQPGPNGECRQAMILWSSDAGRTWAPLPLVRTLRSHLRFWGFPVWPPESIDSISLESGAVHLHFHDEWVPHEPGGESLPPGFEPPSPQLLARVASGIAKATPAGHSVGYWTAALVGGGFAIAVRAGWGRLTFALVALLAVLLFGIAMCRRRTTVVRMGAR
jgi:hypothetical protein